MAQKARSRVNLNDVMNDNLLPEPPPITKDDIASPTKEYTRLCDLTDQLLKRVNSPYTPDFLDLRLKAHIPIFVYDGLKVGGPFYKQFLGNYPAFGEARTATAGFMMKDIGGHFPVAIPCLHGQEVFSGYIYGEIYMVDIKGLLEIDRLMKNTQVFQRTERWIVPFEQSIPKRAGGSMRPYFKCWVYTGIQSWVGQQSSTLCIPKNSQGNGRYYEWENKKVYQTQLEKMRDIWDQNHVHVYPKNPDFNDSLPF